MSGKLTRNISYLTLSQLANYVLPLVTIPYITRVVGPSNYGVVEFVTVVLIYFIVIVDYSFNTTGTRKIAAHAKNKEKVSFIFSSIIVAKFLLLGISLAIFSLLMLFIPTFQENSRVFWMAFPIVLGWVLYPEFLFNGVQKLGVVAVGNFAIKGLAAACVFLFIKEQSDYFLIPFINGVTQLIVGALSLWYLFKIAKLAHWIKPKKRAVFAAIKEGRFVFLSNYFTRIYGFGSIFIGGFLLSSTQVGLYSAAAKLVTVAQSFLFLPLYGALFPFLSQKRAVSKAVYLKEFYKYLTLILIATVLASVFLILLAPFLVSLIFGEAFLGAVNLIYIMAPMLLFSCFVHMFMHQGLHVLKQDKYVMYTVILTGIVSIVLNLILIPLFEVRGAAIVKISVEGFIAALAAWFFFRRLKMVK